MKSGYTLIFIGHEQKSKEEGKIVPKGDVRSMQPVRDNADVVVYLTSNGIDENKNVINSSAWFAETNEFFARSRFDYIDTYLEEFSAENLEKVISDAIEKQDKAEGTKAVSFEEQKATLTSDALDYNELMTEIKQVGKALSEQDKLEGLQTIVEKHLGIGKKVTDCKKSQVQVMSIILDDIQELLEEEE